MEPQGGENHRADIPARTLRGAIVKRRARIAAVAYGAWPRIPGSFQPSAARCRTRTVRERARTPLVYVQGVPLRDLARRYAVEVVTDGVRDPRFRSRKRLPDLPGRLIKACAVIYGGLHRPRRHFPAAGQYRPHRHREWPRHRD